MENSQKQTTNAVIAQTIPQISNLFVMSGHVHQICEWSERLNDTHIYETIGTVQGIYHPQLVGSLNEVILVIKDKVRFGLILKIIHPVTNLPLPPFIKIGATIRVVGKMINKCIMRAMKVTYPTEAEIVNFDRIAHICYNRINKN